LYRRTRLQAPPQRIATFPSWAPTRSLDHILCAGFDMCDYEAVVAAGSDHLAIAASIKDRL
ncbi:MAG TPA: EEP domain-containing protein, partial [Arenimonas sp.]|nr:EEP domain-containing protein [Arenimonas sp.]